MKFLKFLFVSLIVMNTFANRRCHIAKIRKVLTGKYLRTLDRYLTLKSRQNEMRENLVNSCGGITIARKLAASEELEKYKVSENILKANLQDVMTELNRLDAER